jgi:hypothetical protein
MQGLGSFSKNLDEIHSGRMDSHSNRLDNLSAVEGNSEFDEIQYMIEEA